ncbi:MAG TPA: orange carotenoid protein N-terminal domain-containing protein [Candidatus Caenarcaniphilales bacterium]
MSVTIESAQAIFPSTQVARAVPATTGMFEQLSVDDQLAFLWYAYTELGRSITPAAPGAANLQLMEGLLNEIKQMSPPEQTQVMKDLACRADTPISRAYGAFSVNAKLGFWYQLGEWMKQGLVVPMPPGYQMSSDVKDVLEAIQKLDAGQQITVLRNTVVDMGFEPTLIPSKGRDSVNFTFERSEPASATKVAIEGITAPTVLQYIEAMNADDFETAIALFAEDGALQPPFQKPLVGRKAILSYLRDEGQGLNMMPQRGVSEGIDDGYTQHKVTGKVETPWFGGNVGMNIAWRFLLDPQGKIFFVAIDLLASPKELLNLTRR